MGFRLASTFWSPLEQISSDENEGLMIPLSEDEIFEMIRSANSNAASRPDGFSIPFFRQFWPQLKGLIQAIIQGFWLGIVDISRLNYAMLTLIPKEPDAKNMENFRPICLSNCSMIFFHKYV